MSSLLKKKKKKKKSTYFLSSPLNHNESERQSEQIQIQKVYLVF